MDRLKDERFAKFYKKYLEVISGNYAELEKTRQEYLSKIWTWHLGDIYKEYRIYLKNKLMNKLLSSFNGIKWHNTKSKSKSKLFKGKEFEESGIFFYDQYNADDEFSGRYKDVNFRISEINSAIIKGDNNEKTNIKRSFIILSYKFNKKINAKTTVLARDILNSIFSNEIRNFLIAFLFILFLVFWFGFKILLTICWALSFLYIKILEILAFFSEKIYHQVYYQGIQDFDIYIVSASLALKLTCILVVISIPLLIKFSRIKEITAIKSVQLEDLKFSSRFKVYSSDQVEARYLVTPLFMEKLYNLKTVFGGRNIKCSFFNHDLMIVIDTKIDLFELGNIHTPVKDIKSIERFYDEITTIYDLIDYFKLNEKIYLT